MTDKKIDMAGMIETGIIEVGTAQDRSSIADAEALSALMDNEATSLEIRRLMLRISAKPELQDTWKRYHLVHSALQQNMHIRPSVDLLAGIESSLAGESVPARNAAQQVLAKFWKLAGQGAIAASVAAMAVVGITSVQVANRDSGDSLDANSLNVASSSGAQMPVLAGEYQTSSLERTVHLDPAARTRLQQAVYQFSTTPNSVDMPSRLILELPSDATASRTTPAEPSVMPE